MAHGSTLSIALALLFTFTASPSFASESTDYVDVPAEYYFGRWAQGHYATAYGTLRDDRDPIWKTGYGFASKSFRVSIPQLAHYGLWNVENNSEQLAPLNFWWRPGSKWQLGVTDFTYSWARDAGFPQNYPIIQQYESNLNSLNLPVEFISADTLRLLPHQAQYSYYVADFLPAGRFMIHGNMYWRHQSADGSRARVILHNGSLYEQTSESWRRHLGELRTEVSGTYGLTQDINLAGRFTFRAVGDHYDTWTEILYPDLSFEMVESMQEYFEYIGTYQIDFRARTWGSLWTRASLYQDYRENIRQTSERGRTDQGVLPSQFTSDTTSYSPYSTSLALGIDYLTPNGFQPKALIDDYQDYYGHLLGERQWYVHFLLGFQWYKNQSDVVTLSYAIRNGWSDHFEVGLAGNYSVVDYDQDNLIRRYLSMNLQARWRTYRYEPGNGPGWERDSRYDVAFGSMPRAGHWFGTFSTEVFVASDTGLVDANAIAFWDLDYDIGFDYYMLTHRLGLGRQIALEAKETINFAGKSLGKLHINRHSYTVGAVARPLPMVEVSASLSDTFYYYGYNNVAEWRVTVQALL